MSISLLSSCGWSVEQAVQTYFAIHAGDAHAGAASSDAGSYVPPRPVHSPPNSAILPSPSPPPAAVRASGSSSATSFMTPAARPAAAASSGAAAASSASRASGKPSTSPPAAASSPGPSSSPPKPKGGWLGSGLLGKGLGALGRAVWGGGGANADGSASSSAAAPARTPQLQFLHEFGTAYGPHVPDFFPGSYTDAVKEAKSRGRMLFIYLHWSVKHGGRAEGRCEREREQRGATASRLSR